MRNQMVLGMIVHHLVCLYFLQFQRSANQRLLSCSTSVHLSSPLPLQHLQLLHQTADFSKEPIILHIGMAFLYAFYPSWRKLRRRRGFMERWYSHFLHSVMETLLLYYPRIFFSPWRRSQMLKQWSWNWQTPPSTKKWYVEASVFSFLKGTTGAHFPKVSIII